jgi:hypothetical protein
MNWRVRLTERLAKQSGRGRKSPAIRSEQLNSNQSRRGSDLRDRTVWIRDSVFGNPFTHDEVDEGLVTAVFQMVWYLLASREADVRTSLQLMLLRAKM